MLLRVSKKDIKQGVRSSANYCPVALALRRRGYNSIEVGLVGIQLGDLGNTIIISTNKKIFRFILAFDQGKDVKPFWTILRKKELYLTGSMHVL